MPFGPSVKMTTRRQTAGAPLGLSGLSSTDDSIDGDFDGNGLLERNRRSSARGAHGSRHYPSVFDRDGNVIPGLLSEYGSTESNNVPRPEVSDSRILRGTFGGYASIMETRAQRERRLGGEIWSDDSYIEPMNPALRMAMAQREEIKLRALKSATIGMMHSNRFVMFMKECAGQCAVTDFASFFEDVSSMKWLLPNINDRTVGDVNIDRIIHAFFESATVHDRYKIHRILRPIPMAIWKQIDTQVEAACGMRLIDFVKDVPGGPHRDAVVRLFGALHQMLLLRTQYASQVRVQLTYHEIHAVYQNFHRVFNEIPLSDYIAHKVRTNPYLRE